jgi:S1-C subfamily serine protease
VTKNDESIPHRHEVLHIWYTKITMKKVTMLLVILASVCVPNLSTNVVQKALRSCVSVGTMDEFGAFIVNGAGFIVAKDYVITANHVIANMDEVWIRRADGCLVKATKAIPLYTDKTTPIDAVLLQVSTDTLPPVVFGDPDTLEQGDSVFAVGAPFGLEQSVTVGIVSAKHRYFVVGNTEYSDNIQTDGLIHPGNSGGPLFTSRGRVVGVNVVGLESLGMAVPISQVRTALRRNGL